MSDLYRIRTTRGTAAWIATNQDGENLRTLSRQYPIGVLITRVARATAISRKTKLFLQTPSGTRQEVQGALLPLQCRHNLDRQLLPGHKIPFDAFGADDLQTDGFTQIAVWCPGLAISMQTTVAGRACFTESE